MDGAKKKKKEGAMKEANEEVGEKFLQKKEVRADERRGEVRIARIKR